MTEADAAMTGAAGSSLLPPSEPQVQHSRSLVSELHAFELQLAVLRRRAHQLAADRALMQQQAHTEPAGCSAAAVAGAAGLHTSTQQQHRGNRPSQAASPRRAAGQAASIPNPQTVLLGGTTSTTPCAELPLQPASRFAAAAAAIAAAGGSPQQPMPAIGLAAASAQFSIMQLQDRQVVVGPDEATVAAVPAAKKPRAPQQPAAAARNADTRRPQQQQQLQGTNMQQQMLQAPFLQNRQQATPRRGVPFQRHQPQQQGCMRQLAPLSADDRAYALAALDLEACLPQGGDKTWAAAHSTVQELVQLLCPSLDTLLALTRETAGHLAEVPYGPVEPTRPHWQSQLVPEAAVPESQLVSPSGAKAAMQCVTLPSLKAACSQALAAASSPEGGGGVRAFFWAVLQQLKAELQHGATAQHDSQEQAVQALRSCVLSCAHVARCLVTTHNMLARAGQAQQQQGQQAAEAAAAEPPAQACPLVRGLCPDLDGLLALTPATAPPLRNLPFKPAAETDAVRWESRLNQPVPGLQLQSVAGVMHALQHVAYERFRMDVVRVLNRTAAAATAEEEALPPAAAAAAGGGGGQQAGDDAGLRGFFWGVHALLCTELEQIGVRVPQGSQAQDDSVTSVAHVANLLAALYRQLLVPGGVGQRGTKQRGKKHPRGKPQQRRWRGKR